MKSTEAYNAHHGAASTLFLSLCLLLTLCLAGACSDDYDDAAPAPRQGMVTLSLPGVLTRAASSDTDEAGATYIPVENGGTSEGAINPDKGLWFFAFPVKNADNDTDYNPDNFYSADILSRLSAVDGNNHRQLQIPLPYGTYHFYLAGNIAGLQHVRSEQALQQIYLAYTQGTDNKLYVGSNGGELKAGNLPMFRDGAPLEVTINDQTGNTTPVADMHLTFLCAKVTLNMQMAPGTTTANSQLQKLHLSHLAQTSPVVLLNYLDEKNNGKVFANAYQYEEFSPKRKEECPNGYLAANTIATPASPVAESEDNGNQRPANAVPLMDGTDPIAIPAANEQPALVATFYLPEYYVKASDSATSTDYIKDTDNNNRRPSKLHLTVDGTLYTLPLGGLATTEYTGSDTNGLLAQSKFPGGNLVRGTHYDLTAYVPDPGEEWTLTVTPYAWTTRTLNTAFRETELWVSDTKVDNENNLISPYNKVAFYYTTNAASVSVQCTDSINGKPIIIAKVGEADANGKHEVMLSLNPDITVEEFAADETYHFTVQTESDGETSYNGTTTVRLTANNLCKEIDVQFMSKKYFDVTPTEITLTQPGEENGSAYQCRTNKGQLQLVDANGTIINFNDNGQYITSDYTLQHIVHTDEGYTEYKAWANQLPEGSETTITFTVQSVQGDEVTDKELIKLTIMPKDENYYNVYFTAINSFLKAESSHKLAFCNGWNVEFYDYNNIDTYWPQTWVSRKEYNAAAETSTTYGKKIDDKPCYAWRNIAMDITNGEATQNLATTNFWQQFTITGEDAKPGVTFIKFKGMIEKDPETGNDLIDAPDEDTYREQNNSANKWNGYVRYQMRIKGFDNTAQWATDSPMRYPYYNNSLVLFDYTNRQGWAVADPTVLKAQFYDFEPDIVNVKYVVDIINCEKNLHGMRWYLDYGQITHKDNSDIRNGQFLIQSEQDTNKEYEKIRPRKVADNHYRFIFELESVKHNTAKDIKILVRTDDGTIECGTLFNGQDYSIATYESEDIDGDGDNKGIVAAGIFDCSNGTWKPATSYSSVHPEEIAFDPNFTMSNMNLAAGSDCYIYFYKPMEPAVWDMTSNVGLNLGGKSWDSSITMAQYATSNIAQTRWFWWNANGNTAYNSAKDRNSMIAIFYNDHKNDDDDKSDSNVGIGYVYKSDCWSWASAYNNYYPDFIISKGNNVSWATGSDGYNAYGDGRTVYYMDRKAFVYRPR